jgi:hypothetical protein
MGTKELFLVTGKYTKQLENGTFKRVSENFLIPAITFGEAETKMFKHFENKTIGGDVNVTGMKRENFADLILNGTDGEFFKAGVSYSTVDDKKIKVNFLVESENIEKATESLTNYLQEKEYHSFQIVNLGVSQIVEVVE